MKKPIIVMIGAALFIQATLFPSLSRAGELPTFTQLYVFGDSLSDVGNDLILSTRNEAVPLIPPPTRYFDGRFSNHLVWVDYLAQDLVAQDLRPSPLLPSERNDDLTAGVNVSFAYGAAGTGDWNLTPDGFLRVKGLLGQVKAFVKAVKKTANADALYVVWSGANDYLLSMPEPNSVEGIPFPPDPEITVDHIITAIKNLYKIGARQFLVLNLPDLGNIPITAVFGIQVQLTQLTYAHNNSLDHALKKLKAKYKDTITIYEPDIFTLFETINEDLKYVGFSYTMTDLGPATGCLVPLPPPFQLGCSQISLRNDGGFLFWDEQHPTTELHELIKDEALEALATQ